jgi:hypothetical protein
MMPSAGEVLGKSGSVENFMITDVISPATFASTKAIHSTNPQLSTLPPDYAIALLYVRMRIALFISKRHRRSRHFGTWALLHFTPNEFGLINLYGIVVSPRAGKPWREKPNAGGERRR